MILAELVMGGILTLALAEFSDVSPWLAHRLVRWSARVRYVDESRAEIRAEEWKALIDERPGKLFKLGTGMRFAASAAMVYFRRQIWGDEAAESAGDGPLDDLASNYVARFLFPTERYRGEWKRHWFHFFRAWLIGTTYAGLAIWAVALRIKPQYQAWLIVGLVAWYVLWIVYRLANWYFTRFVITNKRLMSTEGLLIRRVGMIPLIQVTDMRYEQSVIGRFLNFGTFKLESASRANVMRIIKDLPNPNELYLRVVEEMYEPEAVENRLASVDETRNLADPESTTGVAELPQQLAELSRQIQRLAAEIRALRKPPS